jgi:uncharacterized membrane protein YqjE
MNDDLRGTAAFTEHEGRPASLGSLIGGLLSDLPGLVGDRVELLSLELHRAGLALLHMAILGMALTVLGMAGWVIVWALLLLGLVAAGLSWATGLGVALLAHALLGWWAVNRIRRLIPTLGLPATRRQLTFGSATSPDDAFEEEPHVSHTAH